MTATGMILSEVLMDGESGENEVMKKCFYLQILDGETLNILYYYPIHDTVTGKVITHQYLFKVYF